MYPGERIGLYKISSTSPLLSFLFLPFLPCLRMFTNWMYYPFVPVGLNFIYIYVSRDPPAWVENNEAPRTYHPGYYILIYIYEYDKLRLLALTAITALTSIHSSLTFTTPKWEIGNYIPTTSSRCLWPAYFNHFLQTLSETRFGATDEGLCSKFGLNVVPPLYQGISLEAVVRREFKLQLEDSPDPDIRSRPDF